MLWRVISTHHNTSDICRCCAGDDVFFFMGSDFTHSDAHMWCSNVDKVIQWWLLNWLAMFFALLLHHRQLFSVERGYMKCSLEIRRHTTCLLTPSSKNSTRRWLLPHQFTQGLHAPHVPPMSCTITNNRLRCLLVVWHAGTQKQHVTADYEHWIHIGMVRAAPQLLQGLQQLLYPAAGREVTQSAALQPATGDIFKRRLSQTPQTLQPAERTAAAINSSRAAGVISPAPLLSMCLNLNSSLCSSSVAISSGDGFLLVVYNPVARAYTWGVWVPVAAGVYSVTALDGKPVHSQLLPLSLGTGLIWPSSASAQEAALKPSADLALLVTAPALGHSI
jgi:hypothetical protein